VVGAKLQEGEKAPDFELLANDFSMVTLANSAGKVRLFSVVPSLDTGVCDAQTRRFNEEISKFGENVIGYTVSVDLPFAQARWCGAAGVERIQTLSDYQEVSFGKAYGTYVKDIRLDQRAVFVVDQNDTIRYTEYVPVGGQHPDYEAALAALRKVVDETA
jgi:thiol peroxidase